MAGEGEGEGEEEKFTYIQQSFLKTLKMKWWVSEEPRASLLIWGIERKQEHPHSLTLRA